MRGRHGRPKSSSRHIFISIAHIPCHNTPLLLEHRTRFRVQSEETRRREVPCPPSRHLRAPREGRKRDKRCRQAVLPQNPTHEQVLGCPCLRRRGGEFDMGRNGITNSRNVPRLSVPDHVVSISPFFGVLSGEESKNFHQRRKGEKKQHDPIPMTGQDFQACLAGGVFVSLSAVRGTADVRVRIGKDTPG